MGKLRHLVFLAVIFPAMAARYQTTNFTVDAPNAQIAQQVGQYAEHYRKEKAVQWLGREMPQWPEPCPLKVTVTMNGSGGATSFAFDRGRILGQNMHIEGSLERLLASVLPHEVTHTVFAHHFRQPVPRWADEGGSVLSEDDIERTRHDSLVRQILNTPGRAIPLRRLFSLKEYPSDVMCLYAQGYSVTNFLVQSSNRATFLNFVSSGMREGWDRAVQTHYRYQSVEQLEQAWLDHLRQQRRQPPAQLAQNTQPRGPENDSRVVVRQTVPPAQPFDNRPTQPIVRGARPDEEQPRYLPETNRPAATLSPPVPMSQQPDRWVPTESRPSSVRLGAPEYVPPTPPTSAPAAYQTPGYPN
jgi:hypothetical protein